VREVKHTISMRARSFLGTLPRDDASASPTVATSELRDTDWYLPAKIRIEFPVVSYWLRSAEKAALQVCEIL